MPGGFDSKTEPERRHKVYLTSDPKPHWSIASEAIADNWYIYRVVPTGKMKVGADFSEYYTDKPCIVVERMGNARGISKAGKPFKRGDEEVKESYREEIKELQQIMDNPQKRKKWEKENRTDLAEYLKNKRLKIQFRNPGISMVPKADKIPPGYTETYWKMIKRMWDEGEDVV